MTKNELLEYEERETTKKKTERFNHRDSVVNLLRKLVEYRELNVIK